MRVYCWLKLIPGGKNMPKKTTYTVVKVDGSTPKFGGLVT